MTEFNSARFFCSNARIHEGTSQPSALPAARREHEDIGLSADLALHPTRAGAMCARLRVRGLWAGTVTKGTTTQDTDARSGKSGRFGGSGRD